MAQKLNFEFIPRTQGPTLRGILSKVERSNGLTEWEQMSREARAGQCCACCGRSLDNCVNGSALHESWSYIYPDDIEDDELANELQCLGIATTVPCQVLENVKPVCFECHTVIHMVRDNFKKLGWRFADAYMYYGDINNCGYECAYNDDVNEWKWLEYRNESKWQTAGKPLIDIYVNHVEKYRPHELQYIGPIIELIKGVTI